MTKKEYINSDNKFIKDLSKKTYIKLLLVNDHWIQINRYIKYLRKQEYYQNHIGFLGNIISLFYGRRKNSLGNKLGFYIPAFTLAPGVEIYHHGSVIINGNAKIGEGCKLHGMNCIGNNGITEAAPVLGKNVDVGVGVKIIGDVTLADDIKIGANAVVTKSFLEKGCTLVGIPARIKE